MARGIGSYTLSRKADADVQDIAEESVKRWGLARAEQYILALHEAFERLAKFPNLGRDASEIRPGYLRMESGSHSVFYRKTKSGVLIVRVLHERMDFKRHL
jgi:toxin ParE1/3/4